MSLDVTQAHSHPLQLSHVSLPARENIFSAMWAKAAETMLKKAREFYSLEKLIHDDFGIHHEYWDWTRRGEVKTYLKGAKFLGRALYCIDRAHGENSPHSSLIKLELAQLHRANGRHDKGEEMLSALAKQIGETPASVAALIQFYNAGSFYYQLQCHAGTYSMETGKKLYLAEQKKYAGLAEIAIKNSLRLLNEGADEPVAINHNYLVARALCRYSDILRHGFFERARLDESEFRALDALDVVKHAGCKNERWLKEMKLEVRGCLFLAASDRYDFDHPRKHYYWNRMEELRSEAPKYEFPEEFVDSRPGALKPLLKE